MKGRDILARNLERLMELNDLKTQSQAAKFARVSQTMIGNILRRQQGPTVDYVKDLADGFKIPIWVLLGPVEFLDDGAHLSDLSTWFSQATAEGQKTILRVAEVEAQSGRRAANPEDS